jgi:hypothetical protein
LPFPNSYLTELRFYNIIPPITKMRIIFSIEYIYSTILSQTCQQERLVYATDQISA